MTRVLRILRKAVEFIRRDFIDQSSYKMAFVFEAMASVFPVLSFFFVGVLVDAGQPASLDAYGGQYFPFVLVGLAFSQYLMAALRTFAGIVRRAQTTGVFEAMLSTRTSPAAIILYTSGYSFLVSTVHVVLVFALGGLLLEDPYRNANLVSAVVATVLTMATFTGFGILSAAIIVVVKKGDPIEFAIGSASALLGGAYFPVSVMPESLQSVSKLLPITYALDAMRRAVIGGESITALATPLLVLVGMAALLVPGSLWAFTAAVEKGRRDGTLMQY